MADPGRNPLTHARLYEDEMPRRPRISPITSDCVILSGLKRHSGEMTVPQTAYAVFSVSLSACQPVKVGGGGFKKQSKVAQHASRLLFLCSHPLLKLFIVGEKALLKMWTHCPTITSLHPHSTSTNNFPSAEN